MSNCFLETNCDKQVYNKKIDCNKDFCIKKYKLEYLYKAGLFSATQRDHISLRIDEDGTDYREFKLLSEIETNILKFVNDGLNLYIHSSNPGTGKTSWSLRLTEAYFNKIWKDCKLTCKVLFVSVPKFLLALKDSISKHNEYAEYLKVNIPKADLVIWDDIAAKMGSEYEINYLLNFIDNRTAYKKANIFTSNLNAQEIYAALGERLGSRICNLAIDVEFHGKDKRKVVTNNSVSELFNGGNDGQSSTINK